MVLKAVIITVPENTKAELTGAKGAANQLVKKYLQPKENIELHTIGRTA